MLPYITFVCAKINNDCDNCLLLFIFLSMKLDFALVVVGKKHIREHSTSPMLEVPVHCENFQGHLDWIILWFFGSHQTELE